MSTAEAPVMNDARPMLVVWAGVLAVGLLIAAGWQAGLAGYVEMLRKDSPWTYLKAAERYQQEKNVRGALDMLREAAKHGPESPLPYERMGMIFYEERGDWAASLDAFQKAIERGSDNVEARGKIIWSLIHLKRYEEAATFGQECLDKGIDAPNFPRYIGEAWFRAGQHAKAIPYFEKALKIFSSDLLLMERLQNCYLATGDKDKAQQVEKRIHEHEG